MLSQVSNAASGTLNIVTPSPICDFVQFSATAGTGFGTITYFKLYYSSTLGGAYVEYFSPTNPIGINSNVYATQTGYYKAYFLTAINGAPVDFSTAVHVVVNISPSASIVETDASGIANDGIICSGGVAT